MFVDFIFINIPISFKKKWKKKSNNVEYRVRISNIPFLFFHFLKDQFLRFFFSFFLLLFCFLQIRNFDKLLLYVLKKKKVPYSLNHLNNNGVIFVKSYQETRVIWRVLLSQLCGFHFLLCQHSDGLISARTT